MLLVLPLIRFCRFSQQRSPIIEWLISHRFVGRQQVENYPEWSKVLSLSTRWLIQCYYSPMYLATAREGVLIEPNFASIHKAQQVGKEDDQNDGLEGESCLSSKTTAEEMCSVDDDNIRSHFSSAWPFEMFWNIYSNNNSVEAHLDVASPHLEVPMFGKQGSEMTGSTATSECEHDNGRLVKNQGLNDCPQLLPLIWQKLCDTENQLLSAMGAALPKPMPLPSSGRRPASS